MNVNVYLEDQLAKDIGLLAKETNKTRNALIREALQHFVHQQRQKKWPDTVLNFEGVDDPINFEVERESLKPPKEDPFK